MSRTKTLRTDYLARVEGEGAMLVKIRDGKPVDVKLRIYEPPRFFEAFLRGRHFTEAPDITARICGICPVAYQTSSVNAMEDACGVEVGAADPGAAPASLLRRVDREPCAARLHAPRPRLPRLRERDRARQGPPRAGRARAAHEEDGQRGDARDRRPRGAPDQRQGRRLLPGAVEAGTRHARRRPRARPRIRARDRALHRRARLPRLSSRTTSWWRSPQPDAYAVEDGRLVSNRGLDIPVSEYEQHFVEEHVEWSNALHSHVIGRGNYLVGPLARWALSGDRLTPLALEAASEARASNATSATRSGRS